MNCPLCVSTKTSFFAKKDVYSFRRCSRCKTIFLTSLPQKKELKVHYSKQFSYNDGLQNEKVIRSRSNIILRKIRQFYPHTKTLCDVGSGFGFFLDEAHHSGFEVTGIEPSKQLANFSKQNYHIFPYIGELKTYIRAHHNNFDIVTCIHVIEHVADPKAFITALLQLVKPGGLLYLETPNSDSHLLYAEKEKYTFLIPPDHLWLFSLDSIKNILPKKTEIINISTYTYPEHVMGIGKALSTSLFRLAPRSVSEGGNNIEVRNINIMKTVKKKIFFYLFDSTIAPLFTGIVNLYHKGSILELYIRKKNGKCGL